MKTISIIFIILGGLVALFLLIAVFLPGEFTVEREMVIEKPAPEVYTLISDFTMREAWDPWLESDSTAWAKITPSDSIVGSRYEWGGQDVGAGYMVIEKSEKNEKIVSSLVFTEPRRMEGEVIWLLDEQEGKTLIKWIMTGPAEYPIGRYFGLFTDGMVGPDLEKGLENLEKLLSTPPEQAEKSAEQ